MIDHTETFTLLVAEFPEMSGKISGQTSASQVHAVARSFARFTQELIDLGDFRLVRTCFRLAERLLSQGDGVLRNAMENSFLFSLHLDWAGDHNLAARQMLPFTLKKAYYALINPSLSV
ncbi:MAG: hypothetical protein H7Z75_22225 [Ferruginibacter sp.]|nr:hypothetical protein [Cytophagales bacterium]